jgi:hypothetical protein
MKRIILIVMALLLCAFSLFAQNKNVSKPQCSLGLDRAPELRGFRLGVPQAAVLARFPGTSVDKPDKFGATELRLGVIDSSVVSKGLPVRDKGVQPDLMLGADNAFIVDSARFQTLKGVRRIGFRFLDGRLSFIQLAYDDSIKWNSVDEFVETVAKALTLSPDWSLPPDADGSNSGRELRCEGFVITASVGADASDTRIGAQLALEDLQASKLLEKRQNDLKDKAQRDEDAKRKNFKP